MKAMIYGDHPNFDEMMRFIADLEARINSQL